MDTKELDTKELLEIIRALTDADPLYSHEFWDESLEEWNSVDMCRFCDAERSMVTWKIDHAPTCLWLRARAVIANAGQGE